MMTGSPLLGYNTNVRHAGKLYHIQTEDSGSKKAHIFTHLFADGGRIVASKKTTYAQYVDTPRYPESVKLLMRESHKAMFIALRDGYFDEDEAAGAQRMAELNISLDDEHEDESLGRHTIPDISSAAQAGQAEVEAPQPTNPEPIAESTAAPTAAYAGTEPAIAPSAATTTQEDDAPVQVLDGDLVSEQSLDEVILGYLREEIEESPSS